VAKSGAADGEWTVGTLKALMDERQAHEREMRDLSRQLQEALTADRGQSVSRDEWYVSHQALIERMEAALKPLSDFVATQRGSRSQALDSRTILFAVLALVVTFGAILSSHIH
jgi:hypothetical protein